MSRRRKPPPLRQRPIAGGRAQLPAFVIDELAGAIEATARRFNVSRSFVIAVALADQFGIEIDSYIEPRTKSWRQPLRLVR